MGEKTSDFFVVHVFHQNDIRSNQSGELSAFGEHVFDEAQNAVEVSLYRALTQFESELQQEKKVIDAVISTDATGGSLFITGAFIDLLNWFFLDCGDDKFGVEFVRFLCIYRMFEGPQVWRGEKKFGSFFFFFFFLFEKKVLFDRISQCLRNPGSITTNNFDKDLIIARTRNALRMWISIAFYSDIAQDASLLRRVRKNNFFFIVGSLFTPFSFSVLRWLIWLRLWRRSLTIRSWVRF